MKNTDRVVDYILKNVKTLSADKIEALSKLAGELKDENVVMTEPNTIPVAESNEDLMSQEPVAPADFAEINGVQIDNEPRKKVQIFGTN